MRFEGLRLKAARLADGGWTIGYGHTASAREGAEVSAADAEALLLYDLGRAAAAVEAAVLSPLTDNQFSALTAFAFNVGVERFNRSDVLKRLNEGSYLQAAAALELWRRADFDGESIVVDALVRRRAAEKLLFLTPSDGFRAIPTPVVRPELDRETLRNADELEVPLEAETAEAVRPDAEPEAEGDAESAPAMAARSVIERLNALLEQEPLVTPKADAPATFEPSPFPSWAPAETFSAGAHEALTAAEAETVSHPAAPEVEAAFEPMAAEAEFTRLRETANDEDPAGFLAAPGILAVGVFGAVLFVAAQTTILFGGLSWGNIGLAAVGTVCMAPALVRILEARHRRKRRR